MDYFFINIDNAGRHYALFYFLAFLAGLILLVIEGQKRKFPIVPWLLVITTAFLFFMAGSQVIKFSAADWLQIFRFEKLNHVPARSVLGGILFVVPALVMAKYALRFRYSMMDAFAFVLPVGMVIQRMGCLLAGCCHGRPTSVPWGIKYNGISDAFQHHRLENLIPPNASFSLPVHPAQVYDMIGCLLILLALACLKRFIRVSGNLFLTAILLYGHVRFVTEFFRAPASGSINMMGLTIVQVFLLLLIPILLSIILVRERRIREHSAGAETSSPPRLQLVLYSTFIVFLFLLFSRWLSPLEVVTLNLVLLPTLALICWHIFKCVTVAKMRWVTGSLVAGSLVMMSQTLPEKSKSDSTRISYNIISIGTLTGNSNFTYQNYDCSGTLLPEARLENFYNGHAAGISRVVQQKENRIVQYGIDGFIGRHTEEVDGGKTHDIALVGVHPYFQYDAKLVGFGVGFHAGRLSELTDAEVYGATQLKSLRTMNFYPSAYFRIGYINKVFGEIKLAQQFPTNFPSLGLQTNLGIGFGKNNGGAFRIGTASFAGVFLAPSFPVGKNVIIEPYIGFLRGFLHLTYDEESNFTGAISLRYKFNFKERPLP
jgi:phosphatidylglycerol:prolipoprotein diacylglycerol transferase